MVLDNMAILEDLSQLFREQAANFTKFLEDNQKSQMHYIIGMVVRYWSRGNAAPAFSRLVA